MSNYYLNTEDFALNGNNLIIGVNGITLVMFYSQNCKYCSAFMPQYLSLPGSIIGVNFGLCCVDGKNNQIIKMSKTSSTPIAGVPKIILYNDGVPYVEYTGQRNRQNILQFLQDILIKLNQKQSFTKPKRTRSGVENLEAPPPSRGSGGALMKPPMPSAGGVGGPPKTASYKITQSTGVKEYETSYGLPYNAGNEANFLEYESAYLNEKGNKRI